jgi:tetratricopeptide (TPR) repeat protein
VLMTLSVFSGGFALRAAEAVCAENDVRETTALDAIERLVAKSLLVVEHDDGADTRYRMLETIRQYANEKLLDAQRADTARRRHFDYFVELAERAEPELRKANVLEWLDRLDAEHDNLGAALDWAADANAQGYARLAGALYDFWNIRGHFVEGLGHLERAVELHATEDTPRLKALLGAGALSYRLDKRKHSADLLDSAAALARWLADTRSEAEATLWRACALDAEGADFIESMAERALALSRSIDNAWCVGFATWHFALAMYLRDRFADAQRLCLESAAQFDRGGCVLMAALARGWAGQCAIERLDFQSARSLLEGALAEQRRLGNVHDAGTTLRSLAQLDLNIGSLDEALCACEESAAIFRTLHDPNCGARTNLVSGSVHYAMGEHELALRHAKDAAETSGSLGFHHNRAAALWLIGRAQQERHDLDAAMVAYFEALREIKLTTHDALLPALLEAAAGTHPGAPVAPRLIGCASAIREVRNIAVFPSERRDIERWIAAVKAAHRDAFEREFAEGRSMTRDDAIAEALTLQAVERAT